MFSIAGRQIGSAHPPYIIAEVAQSHEGSLGAAFAFAEVAHDCGADAIKFQTHFAREESTPAEPWRVPFSKQDASRYEYWRRMEFRPEEWRELKLHCDEIGIDFISSPFSLKACDLLEDLGMPVWKVASGEIHNRQLLDRMAQSDLPIMLSTGLVEPKQGIAIARGLMEGGSPVGLFHCTTQYPTPPESEGLNVMQDYLAALAPTPVGLSDHSGSIYAGVVATYLGASMIETHLTLHPKAFGPDVTSSLTPEGLTELVRGARAAWVMRCHPVNKSDQLANMGDVRKIFTRSLCARSDIAQGTRIEMEHLAYKKPAGGLTYEDRTDIIGKVAARAIGRDEMIGRGDVR